MTKLLSALVACCAAIACCHVTPAAAQSTWNLGSGACNATPTASFGTTNSAVCTVGTETATMTGWYLNSAGNAYVQGTLGNFDPSGMGLYSGSGETGADSQHAFDNATSGCGASNASTCGSSQEMMLINFGANKVSLSAVALGYIAGDGDIAVMRWDGAASGPLVNGLSGAGWNLVATQDVLNTGAKVHNSNNASNSGLDAWQSTASFGNQVSSWWLVSTYYGQVGTSSLGSLSTGDDRFKILGLTANVCTGTVTGGNSGNGGTCSQVPSAGRLPEPGSLALTALALLGVVGVRRKLG